MKNIKKLLSIMIIALLVVTSVPVQADAAVKISATKKTLTVGKSATIKIMGAKKPVKWSVSNGHIRITGRSNSYAVIKAVSKGTSTLKAKCGKKTYKCKVSVKASNTSTNSQKVNFKPEEAKKSMEIEEIEANNTLFVKVKSGYEYATDISAKCTFYDSSGNPVDYDSDSVPFLEKGHACFLEFSLPSVSYSKYNIEYEYSEGMEYLYHLSVIDGLSLSTNYVEDEYSSYIMLQISNSGKEECYYCEVATIYYGANGEILDITKESIGKISSGSSATEKSYTPYDKETYEDIKYDHYESFITYAYHLGEAGETH